MIQLESSNNECYASTYIYIYIYIKLRFLAFLSSIFPSKPNKPNLIYQNFLFRNCFGFQMCKVLWVSLLCAWSKPKWLSTCCGALITQRQLLNWRKIHSMLFFLAVDDSSYCSYGGIGGVYQSLLVMTLGFSKLEQFPRGLFL